ncbi:hypothetical protein AXG93_3037s1120 [Marchantia polymorpha subsp. ruderalis]|uniref:Uncharacterized protein n=1 Tax=Marchantia polymorpha subsp. ruderalis TaxID=1480154 RepID=A0A176WLH2_MARPO|nr:hypothetical protein AXG93_3037s1120 [Marchantia polymorpha subsp. ruderalis]
MSSRATRKEKSKAIMTKEVPPVRDKVSSADIRMKAPLERPVEVLAVSSDTKEDSMAVEKVAERVVEDVVLPLLRYLNPKRGKYAETTTNESYVELVRNRTQAKVAATSVAAAKERQTQETEAKYEVLRKRLVEEVEKWRYSEKTCEGFREDIENVKCVTVDLRRLEASRIAYNAKSRRFDELTVASEKKEHEHAAELAEKMKDQAECEAARISDLELIEKLESQCSELRSQRTQAEEQLCDIEMRLSQAKRRTDS